MGKGELETYQLACHPDTPCKALDRLIVEVSRPSRDLLRLWFTMTGEVEAVSIPALAPHERRDELWKHTCFEAFIGLRSGGYLEFNLSPASHWAAYSFEGYRGGMQNLDQSAPVISTAGIMNLFAVGADIELSVPEFDLTTSLALSAVIEELDGTKSYWALAHPPGQPDFHHPTCFAATLPAPSNT